MDNNKGNRALIKNIFLGLNKRVLNVKKELLIIKSEIDKRKYEDKLKDLKNKKDM